MNKLIKTLLMTHVAIAMGAMTPQLSAAEPSSVAYRLKETKTMHFDDVRKARLHLDAVKKLGCEAKMDDHGNHFDVMYRLTTWKALTLADERTAHQWEDWMKKSGFETLHAHGDNGHAGHNHGLADGHFYGDGHNHGLSDGHFHGDGHDHSSGAAEVLTYSLREWKTTHTRDRREAEELTAVLKARGCDVRSQAHGDHDDVVFRCPRPMHLDLPSHRVASGWESWLQRTGFRTEHKH